MLDGIDAIRARDAALLFSAPAAQALTCYFQRTVRRNRPAQSGGAEKALPLLYRTIASAENSVALSDKNIHSRPLR
jgi:hypothetical protein